jgi:hypothetical protein
MRVNSLSKVDMDYFVFNAFPCAALHHSLDKWLNSGVYTDELVSGNGSNSARCTFLYIVSDSLVGIQHISRVTIR